MAEDRDLHVFEIGVNDFDLNLIPKGARTPGTKAFTDAVKNFYEDQLRKIVTGYSVTVESGKIRVTWRKSEVRPDALDEAVEILKQGNYGAGIQILEFLLPSRQDDPMVNYNLGMAYSDQGKLDDAIAHLRRTLAADRRFVNARVALGVAYARQKRYEDAAAELKEAVLDNPDNGYALRNLGAVLMQLGREKQDAIRYLRRATELLPQDQQAWFGLAQAQMDVGDSASADETLIKAINIQPYSPIAEMAKQLRSQIAQQNFRKSAGAHLRMDAVMYCMAALQKFAEMTPDQVQSVGFEIATLGMNGIDTNDAPKYRLRTLPGTFSGNQLLCYEYVAFKQIAPQVDIGWDVSKEYEEAKRLTGKGA